MSLSLVPFLEMNGSAKEAIDLYVKALDAKVVYNQSFGDLPENPETPLPPNTKDMISFAILKIGESELHLSDNVTGSSYQKGTQVTIVIQTNDKSKAIQYYETLKQDGHVNNPLQETFFSPAYGNVTDKFGITFRILTKGRQ